MPSRIRINATRFAYPNLPGNPDSTQPKSALVSVRHTGHQEFGRIEKMRVGGTRFWFGSTLNDPQWACTMSKLYASFLVIVSLFAMAAFGMLILMLITDVSHLVAPSYSTGMGR